MKNPSIRAVEVGPLPLPLKQKRTRTSRFGKLSYSCCKKREKETLLPRDSYVHEQPSDKVIMVVIPGLNQFISAEARNIDVIVPDYT